MLANIDLLKKEYNAAAESKRQSMKE